MSKKSKKSKKTTKSKKSVKPEFDHDTFFNIGWNAEQKMAENICNQTSGNSEEGHDTAFIAAFQGLTCRMLRFWKPEFLVELISDVIENSDEPHVCPDCEEVHGGTPVAVSEADKSKLH